MAHARPLDFFSMMVDESSEANHVNRWGYVGRREGRDGGLTSFIQQRSIDHANALGMYRGIENMENHGWQCVSILWGERVKDLCLYL